MTRWRVVVFILTVVVAVSSSRCRVIAVSVPEPPRPPVPTGEFAVGRVTLSLVDTSRQEHVPPGGDHRTLPVDVWYPAESSSAPVAPYFPPAAFADPGAADRLRSYLGAAYESMRGGVVHTHARVGSPFAKAAGPAPLLLFSHGGGEARETYASQLAELASHGYVVAAITHTYDAVIAARTDGRFVLLTPGRWPPPTVSSIAGLPPSEEANREQLQWLARDIRFVMGEVTRPSPARVRPFDGHVDASRVGAFGHSAGGMVAARACQTEPRLIACLNQDGLSAMAPYYLDERGLGMDQAFMLIARESNTTPPTDTELSQMKMTRAQLETLLLRLRARQETALSRTGGGSYRVTLKRAQTTHADFGDLALLNSSTGRDAAHKRRVLDVVNAYTRAFFDRTLRGREVRLLIEPPTSELVTSVDTFPPDRRGDVQPATPAP